MAGARHGRQAPRSLAATGVGPARCVGPLKAHAPRHTVVRSPPASSRARRPASRDRLTRCSPPRPAAPPVPLRSVPTPADQPPSTATARLAHRRPPDAGARDRHAPGHRRSRSTSPAARRPWRPAPKPAVVARPPTRAPGTAPRRDRHWTRLLRAAVTVEPSPDPPALAPGGPRGAPQVVRLPRHLLRRTTPDLERELRAIEPAVALSRPRDPQLRHCVPHRRLPALLGPTARLGYHGGGHPDPRQRAGCRVDGRCRADR